MTVPNPKPSTGPGQDGQPAGPAKPAEGQAPDGADAPSPMAGLAAEYAAKAGLHRTHDGRVDVLRTAGGVQGIAESILPGLLFLVTYTISQDLTVSLVAALATAAVFTVVRLIQRRPLTQALAGVVGVGISAWLANTTGKAEDFYLPGFFTNAAYIVAMVLSIALKWPVAGLLFGFIRNEGLDWRNDPARLKAYRLGTWIIVAVLVLRLVVQVPLYLLGPEGLAALATTRLIMGAPLYILGVWVAWLITRPAPAGVKAPDRAGHDTTGQI
ncbi:Putative membrane protein [Arthrobacter sp. 9AX]|uniref:DUF3159 domain-containing protein n=1 Tax=Arthrobacter sp. 9AX TaxID=2653131 RepID=UPI0012F1B0F8|nr:DUF3159 domain-containing protein [Arthrobacter sp. 9AX]VXB15609.1 Putative membrane protein [Arthrobacter sp. 9AX]